LLAPTTQEVREPYFCHALHFIAALPSAPQDTASSEADAHSLLIVFSAVRAATVSTDRRRFREAWLPPKEPGKEFATAPAIFSF